MVSNRTLCTRKRLPRASAPWVLDSGGFSELHLYGAWETTPRAYVANVKRYATEIGNLEWAACQDWMCEPHILRKTGYSIDEHQYRSVVSYLELMLRAPEIPWCPVLQGWEVADYFRHADLHERMGVRLSELPVVGIGSVCRRQGTRGAIDLLVRFTQAGIRLHGFGLKTTAVRALAPFLASSDSLAWSYRARQRKLYCGSPLATCANHLHYALSWRDDVLASLGTDPVQYGLPW